MLLTKIQYSDTIDRQAKIDTNKGKFLIEEQNITEGNFLIFSDTPRVEEQVAQLKQDNLTLMDAIAQMYEDMMVKGTV
jgi:hypothetical protein